MYIDVWHMNSFKLVFAMVMYLSWKSTQIQIRFSWKSKQKYIFQVWALGGQLHHHSSHLRDGRGKQLYDQGILLSQVVDVVLTKSTWWCWPRWQCWQLLALWRMLINLILSTEWFWPSWWCWISWLYWEISRKVGWKLLSWKIRKLSSVIASALLLFSTII